VQKVYLHFEDADAELRHTVKVTLPRKWNDGPISRLVEVRRVCRCTCGSVVHVYGVVSAAVSFAAPWRVSACVSVAYRGTTHRNANLTAAAADVPRVVQQEAPSACVGDGGGAR
jgi:hypothetical protein